MNKKDFSGLDKVFRFTFMQNMKNKSSIIILLIFLTISVISLPVASIIYDKVSSTGSDVKVVYIKNETSIDISTEDFKSVNPAYKDIEIIRSQADLDSLFSKIAEDKIPGIVIDVVSDPGTFTYNFAAYKTGDSSLSDTDISKLTKALSDTFDRARFAVMGVSDEQIQLFSSGYSVKVSTLEQILDSGKTDSGIESAITTVYDLVLMMLVLFSVTGIITGILTEKSSKVIESLIISVRPLALLGGKILSAMCYTLLNMFVIGAGLFISYQINGIMFGSRSIQEIVDSAGLRDVVSRMDFLSVVVLIVSCILGFLIFSMIAGLSGAACSSTEDLNEASIAISLCLILGVYISMAVNLVNNFGFSVFAYLFPCSSPFIIPVNYILGKTGMPVVLLSWMIQIIIIAALFVFSSRVYRSLIIHSGNRVKIRQMLQMSKSNEN